MNKGFRVISRYLILLVCGLAIAATGATHANAAQVIYSGWCGDGVMNDPPVDTIFTLTEPTNIASIYNYHYNGGAGQDASLIAGTIGIDQIVSETESVVIGRWPVTSWSIQGDANYTGWVVYPNILLGPGTYKVVDSDKATWSYSFGNYWGSGPDWGPGKGFSQIETSAGVTAIQPVNTAVNVPLTQPVTITFNEDVDIYAGDLGQVEVSYVKNSGGRTIVPTTKTVSGNSLVITPITPYRPNTLFTVMLPAGSLRDGATFPTAAYQFVFKTGNQ